MYAITGQFQNPGPYGGFLSICISMLIAYHVKQKNNQQNFFSKLLYWGISLISIVALAILPSTQSRSAILALGYSMILLVFGSESIKNKIILILKKYSFWLMLCVTALIVGAYLFKKPSADGRLFIDKISIKAMYENVWKGVGLGHFGGAYGEAQACYFKKQIDMKGSDDMDWRAIKEHDRLTADCPDNAFNEYLFIGVEAGLVAMLLFVSVIVAAIVVSFRRDTIWCYGLTAFAVFAIFSYPLHVRQFQIMFPILLVACVADKGLSVQKGENMPTEPFYRDRKHLVGVIAMTLALAALSITMVLKLPEIRKYKQAESAWKETERWHQMEYYEYVVEDCDTLLPYMKHNYRFLFAYGQSLNKTGNYEKSDSVLQMGAEISSDPMFWNVMGNNSLEKGEYREAEERYKHAFYMVPNRLYPLYLLAKLYHTEGDTARFLNMADRVETFIPKVESINTERLRAEIRKWKSGYLPDAVTKDD